MSASQPAENLSRASLCVFAGAALAGAFDQLFLHVRVPGVGWALWILTTVLSFAGGAYAAARFAKASPRHCLALVLGFACLYVCGAAYTLMSSGRQLTLTQAAPALIQSFVLACIGGVSGARRGERDALLRNTSDSD